MTNQISWMRVACAIAWVLLLGSVPGWAEVTRMDVVRREDVLGGRAFGSVGPYEKILGSVQFAIDPTNPRNQIIADLDKAPRNAQGKVEFSADLLVLRPKGPFRGKGVVFFDVVYRGRFRLLATFSEAESSNDPTTKGYTLVAVGWQFDVPRGEGRIGLDVPSATDSGQPITGWVAQWFIPREPSDSFEYTGGNNTPAYPPIDLGASHYRLTTREGIFAARRLVPREAWQFGRIVDGRVVTDPDFVTLKTGFKPGLTYEVMYESQNPPVAGLGLAAVRDMASALKYSPDSIAPGRFAYMYGSSQLATLTGWLFRSERIGAPHTLINNGGSYIPFPLTRAERETTGDPRLSIEERYSGRADYLARVEAVASRLAQERYLLQSDYRPSSRMRHATGTGGQRRCSLALPPSNA